MSKILISNFGFSHIPFTREIDERDHFNTPQLKEELSYMEDSLKNRLSSAIIAPPGTGKTCFLRRLQKSLPENRFGFHYVLCSKLGKLDMYREICLALGLPHKGTAPSLRQRLEEYFINMSTNRGIRPVILFDDAHEIRPDVLAILRILTNFEMDSKLVLCCILCGQPSLRQTLKLPALEDVSTRISHVVTLRTLSKEESLSYINHRCALAGVTKAPFDEGALQSIIEQTQGNMRAMDDLCSKTLEVAARDGSGVCDCNQVVQARGYLL